MFSILTRVFLSRLKLTNLLPILIDIVEESSRKKKHNQILSDNYSIVVLNVVTKFDLWHGLVVIVIVGRERGGLVAATALRITWIELITAWFILAGA